MPRKVGLKPVQRDGMEYEFDVIVDLDIDHLAKVSKSRCSALDGKSAIRPDATFVEPLRQWLSVGAKPAATPRFTTALQVPSTEALAASNGDARTEASPHERCTEESARRIVELAQRHQMPKEVLKRILEKRGVEKCRELTVLAAAEIIEALESKLAEKEIPF